METAAPKEPQYLQQGFHTPHSLGKLIEWKRELDRGGKLIQDFKFFSPLAGETN
jgi:hypothetical protein